MLRSRASRLCLVLAAVAALTAASCKKEETQSVVQGLDLEQVEGVEVPFDKNNLLDTASFTELAAVDAAAIERFFRRTPYGWSSFLETYQSNGVRAAEAIARAARTYRINPIVFIVFAQMTEGLVGAKTYPLPPERVEYVFGCGCLQKGKCLPELAGFDRQVDCLGRTLRVALDDIAAFGATTYGWGPTLASTTLDGVAVTPANEATAAIYDRRPVVAERKSGGSWLFWNVWTRYSVALGYFAGGGTFSAYIGDACTGDEVCAYEGGKCALEHQDGLCTMRCDGTCPEIADFRQTFCVELGGSGSCLEVCDPEVSACRDGYTCTSSPRYKGAGAGDAKPVCLPVTAGP